MKNKPVKILPIESKSILTACKIPNIDYTLNPYTGCSFGCRYCYAAFLGKFANEPISKWGFYVYIKKNAAQCLQKELKKLKPQHTLWVGSATDPYQPVEKTWKITQSCLQVLAKAQFQGSVSLLSKSTLVLRDLALLKGLPNLEVGMTLTKLDDFHTYEPDAPSTRARLNVLKKCRMAGLKTFAFVGPLVPPYYEQPELIWPLLDAIAQTGTTHILVDYLNLSPVVSARLDAYTLRHSGTKEQRRYLKNSLLEAIKRLGLTLLNQLEIKP